MKMTKLCCFNQDNPNSLAFDHHAELAASEQVRLTLMAACSTCCPWTQSVVSLFVCVWCRSRMPLTSRGQLTVEKTPSYLVSSGVAERLHNMSTDRDVRLLVVVRDPVTRALSDFTQSQFKRRRRHHREHDRRWSFERRAFIDENRNVVDTSWPAINIGLYARHVRRWLELFPRHHIHFVHGEQLIADPAAQLTDVQTFLGLRPFFTQQHFYFNATKGFPCLLRRPGTADETVHCLGQTKGRVHPTVDGDALKKLHQFYRPHNAEFYALTGINFGWHWTSQALSSPTVTVTWCSNCLLVFSSSVYCALHWYLHVVCDELCVRYNDIYTKISKHNKSLQHVTYSDHDIIDRNITAR